MSNDRFVIVVTEHLHPDAIARLESWATVIQVDPDDGDARRRALTSADGLVVRTYTRVDDTLLDDAPRLRVVGRAGVGLDAIDVAACRARSIEVVHTPDANSHAVVAWVLAATLERLRPLPRVPDRGTDGATWRRLREDALVSRSVESLTVGVLGLGRVGSRVARAFAALGARVLFHDIGEIPTEVASDAGATSVDAATLHAESDILTLHVDGRAANHGLFDAHRLASLRDDVLLINASRGFVIETDALAAFLRSHPAAHAILDVHDPEPVPAGHPLLGNPGATLTPHIASRTEAAQRAMSDVVDDVRAVLEGRPPKYPAPPISE